MTRPYTICHLLCSLDGKISGPFMGSPAAAMGREAYGRLANDFQCQATVYDWSFLAAGCLDEVSLVVAPVVDATPDAATIFERTDGHEHAPAAPLTLASTEDVGEGTLWLRYNVEAG